MTPKTWKSNGTGLPFTACIMLALTVFASFAGQSAYLPTDGPAFDGKGPLDLFSNPMDGMFLENRGQWDDSILFATRTTFGHMAFGREHVMFDVKENTIGPMDDDLDQSNSLGRGTVIRMDLSGTNGYGPKGMGPISTRTNIIHGRDPSGWGIGIWSYRTIVYTEIWEGIDLVVGTKDHMVKYEFVVRPYANTGDIRFSMTGMSSMKVDDAEIRMVTPHGSELIDRDLVSFYRDSPGCTIGSSFKEYADGTIGFSIVGRDPSRTLVIDPVIYSTYIGGSDAEEVVDMVMDDDGACYIAGCTYSFDLKTTPGAYSGSSMGEKEGYVMKIYANGSAPEFVTYIGGSWSEHLTSVDVDGDGNIYVAGATTSADYPTTKGAFNETQYGFQEDLFVSKLDPTGSSLVYSTYLGGNGSEAMDNRGNMLVDSEGYVHLVGTSWSGNFPVTDDAYDKVNKEVWQDDHYIIKAKVVLVKLSADGSDLEYSTYIGGEEWDTACGIDMDSEGFVYITGQTTSVDFPLTPGAFDTSFDGWSAVFVLKFDIARSYLAYSTLLEGSNYQVVKDILVDDECHTFVVGETGSFDFPVMSDAYQSELCGWADIFVTALDQSGSSLYISTFLGGSDGDQGRAIDLGPDGNIYVTGVTFSADYPMMVVNKDDPSDRDPDMVISQLDSSGKTLLQSTVLGGRGSMGGYPIDEGQVISYISPRRVMVAGMTTTTDFPITDDAWDRTIGDPIDHFLMEFDLSLPPSAPMDLSIERGDGSLDLTWAVPETDGGMPIDGYCIFKGTSEDELKQLKLLVSDLFYNDTELSMGSRYYYMVAAVNGVGQGLPSKIVSSGAASSPTPPQFLQLQKGESWVKLTWVPPVFDGASIMTAYRVYRTDGDSKEVMTEIDPFSYRYIDEEVENGKNYSYRMTAVNSIGESEPTETLWTIPSGAPSPPTDLIVQNGPMSVVLSWSTPVDDGGSKVLFYRVHIGVEVADVVQWRYSDSPVASFTDTLVEIGMSYRYFVTAVSSEGESIPSEEVVGRPCSEPSAPEGFQISEGNGYCNLVWSIPTFLGGLDLEGYRVLRSQPGSDMVVIAELSPETTSFKDRNVTNGIEYTYTLVAFNDHGDSAGTAPRSTVPAGVPGVPVGLAAKVEAGFVVLSWGAPGSDGGARVMEYRIFRQTAESGPEQIASVDPDVLSYNDTGVVAGGTYLYTVKTVNRMGSSLSSEKVTVVVMTVPATPGNIILKADDGKVEVTWDAPASDGGSPITSYGIERWEADLSGLMIVSDLVANVRTFTDDTVENGRTYAYSVIATNSVGSSEPVMSDPVTPVGRPGTPQSLVLAERKGTVSIGWMAPASDGGSGIVLYRIYRSFENGPWVLVGVVETGMNAFTDIGPKDEGTYTYMVAAVNKLGEGPAAAQGSVKVKGDDASSDLIKDNIGLFITVPIIIVLAVLLVIMLLRKGGNDMHAGPVPTPSPVEMDMGPGQDLTSQENVMMFEQAMDREQ